MLASSLREEAQATVSNKPGHRGEREVSRKPLRREGRVYSGEPVVTTLVCFVYFAREAAGALATRLSLRPLFSRRRNDFYKTRALSRRGNAGSYLNAPSLRGAKRRSNPHLFCRQMDCFASLAMTARDRISCLKLELEIARRFRRWLLRLLRRLRPHPRPILHGRMRGGETGAAEAEQLFAQRALSVGLLVTPAPGQLRHQHVGDILEIAGRNRKRDIQAVDVGLLEPGFDLVGDFFRRADHHRPDAADADMLGHFAHGPYPVRIGAGDIVHRGAAGVVLDLAHLQVELVGRKIDAGPARHEGKRAFWAD